MGDCYNPYLAITPESLDSFLRWLKEQYRIFSVRELLTATTPGCCITFDDGWEDNYRFAFPILRKHGVPTTIFLATGLVGSNAIIPEERVWRIWKTVDQDFRMGELAEIVGKTMSYSDAQRYFKSLPIVAKSSLLDRLEDTFNPSRPNRASFMTWDHVKAMHDHGVDFGSHTMHHATLGVEPDQVIEDELISSQRHLLENLGPGKTTLAYPNGNYDDRVLKFARKTGYEAGFTTRGGRVTMDSPPLLLPRLALDNLVANDAEGRFSAARMRLHILRSSWTSAMNVSC